MDTAILFAMWIGGMISGAMVVLAWVSDDEVQRHCDETEQRTGRIL